MSEELKPCPFCGRTPNPDWTDESYIECTNRKCSLYGYGMSTGDWNTRPIEDELRARIAELEAKHKVAFGLVRTLRRYCIYAHWYNPDIKDEFNEFDEEICKYISEYKEREE
jgi:hypothetical protein